MKGIKGSRDRKGLSSYTLTFLITDATLDDGFSLPIPVPTGLPIVGRSFREWDVDNNGFILDVTCEGLISEPPPGSDETFSVQPEWREEPIETFPYQDALVKNYGAYEGGEGTLKFPQYIKGGASAGGGLAKAQLSGKETNPLYGVRTYPVLRIVASHSYTRRAIPSSVYSRIGTVIKGLPPGFEYPGDKPFIVDTPVLQSRGNCWSITERYKDIDKLKHLEALYGLMVR